MNNRLGNTILCHLGNYERNGLHYTIYNALSVEHRGVGAIFFCPGVFWGARGALVWGSIVN